MAEEPMWRWRSCDSFRLESLKRLRSIEMEMHIFVSMLRRYKREKDTTKNYFLPRIYTA